MARKLKVYRTTAGFSDAYVAAPSMAAALRAWGSDVDLFARGIADVVTDPALTSAPLAKPGEVITVSRGDLAAHLKALKAKPSTNNAARSGSAGMTAATTKRPKKRRRPQPKRDKLDAAEAALDEALERHQKEIGQLESERKAVERALASACTKRDKELGSLTRKRDKARSVYQDAVDRWADD